MQTFKKISLGLLPAVLFCLFGIATSHKAFAASGGPISGDNAWYQPGATYTMNQKATIVVDLAGSENDNHENISFSDSSPNDTTHTYTADTNGTGVCSGTIKFNSGQTFNNKPIAATLNVTFADANSTVASCASGSGLSTVSNYKINVTNNTSNGGNTNADTGPGSISYNGDTYTQLGTSSTALSRVYGLSNSLSSGSSCYGGEIIVLSEVDSSANAPVTGTVLQTQLNGSVELSSQVSNFPSIPLNITSSTRCMYNSTASNGDNQILSVKADGTATFSKCSKGDSACKPDPSNGGPGTTAPDNSCEANYTGAAHALNWLFCSILEGVDSMFNTIYNTISSQLNICTGKSSTTGDTCSNNLLTSQVEKSWAVFRDLATALLVIIMLIMVFSQAISFGPLDAYTVRKILPRLVAMAILIQISWPMLKFFVDVSNDLGTGIQNIMLAPFGGAGKLAFDNQIGQVSVGAPSLTITAGAVFTGAVLAFSGITIFGWLLIGVSAVISVLVGLLVILFRQMLIVLAIMVAPLAFIAYVLPGTQQYWKLWKDNFTKLLLMFPLIMAMIAGGKIFASVGSNNGSFLGLIVVLVGFVGPLWFLPKTFKWGGQIFAAAASGAWGATKGFRSAPGKYAMSQAKVNRQQREQDRHERLSYGRGRLFDRAISRAGDIGLSSRAAEVREAKHRAEGREAGEKAVAQEIVGSEYEAQDHGQKLVTLDYLAQGETDPATGLDGSNPAMQRWALDQLATFGDWDRIDGLRSSGNLDERVWQQFMAKNISAVHQNAPYLSPLRRDMSQLGYHEAASWKDHAVHEFERQVLTGQIRTADGQGYEDAPDQQRQLALGVDFATRALADDRIRANLSADAIATFERIRDLASPEVRVSRQQGGQVSAHLPSPLLIQNNPAARESLTRNLVNPDAGSRVATQRAVVERLSDPGLDTHSREVMEDFIVNFRMQAQASGSPDVINSYNEILNQWNASIANRPNDAERAAIANGEQGPAIIQARATAQTEADNERSRILASGLTPIATPGDNEGLNNNQPAAGP